MYSMKPLSESMRLRPLYLVIESIELLQVTLPGSVFVDVRHEARNGDRCRVDDTRPRSS